MKKQTCITCQAHPVFFYRECNICRTQWKAFYAGKTPTSPLMRAIAADQSEKQAQSHKTISLH